MKFLHGMLGYLTSTGCSLSVVSMRKTVIVLGGANGAGKTTFARQLFGERLPDDFEFLNADMIAEGLSPFRPEKAAIRAGREFLSRIVEKGECEESFALESTLSGLGLMARFLISMVSACIIAG